MNWLPVDQWERLRQGVDCPFCQDIHLLENAFSFLVKEFQHSFVRLPKNQYMRGWTIVALKRHACELFELEVEERNLFWQEVSWVAEALNRIYRPAKINYCIFGNRCPHIHCHLIVQRFSDDPTVPINMEAEQVFLSLPEYQSMLTELRGKLENLLK